MVNVVINVVINHIKHLHHLQNKKKLSDIQPEYISYIKVFYTYRRLDFCRLV